MQEALNKLRGVSRVAELPTDDRAHSYELTSDQEIDLRPEIFRLIVDKGWVLLELHRDTQTLEDVFRNLTVGETKRNRQLDKARDEDDDEDEDEDDEDEDEDEEDDDDASDDDDDEPKKRGA